MNLWHSSSFRPVLRIVALVTIICFTFSSISFACPIEKQFSSKLRTTQAPQNSDTVSGLMKALSVRSEQDEETATKLAKRQKEFIKLAVRNNISPITYIAGVYDKADTASLLSGDGIGKSYIIDEIIIVKADLGNQGSYYFTPQKADLNKIPMADRFKDKLFIVVNSRYDKKIQDEAFYHDAEEWRLIHQVYRQLGLLGYSQREAHIIASALQVMKFSKNGQPTPYHLEQILNMDISQLDYLLKESRLEHYATLEKAVNNGEKIDINYIKKYESNLSGIMEYQRNLVSLMDKKSTLERKEYMLPLFTLYALVAFIAGLKYGPEWATTLSGLATFLLFSAFVIIHYKVSDYSESIATLKGQGGYFLFQTGKQGRVVNIDTQKNTATIVDSQGTPHIVQLTLQTRPIDKETEIIDSLITHFKNITANTLWRDDKNMRGLIEKLKGLKNSPPQYWTFSEQVEDVTAFISEENNMVVLHQSVANSPFALLKVALGLLVDRKVIKLELAKKGNGIIITDFTFPLTRPEALKVAKTNAPDALIDAFLRELLGDNYGKLSAPTSLASGPGRTEGGLSTSQIVSYIQDLHQRYVTNPPAEPSQMNTNEKVALVSAFDPNITIAPPVRKMAIEILRKLGALDVRVIEGLWPEVKKFYTNDIVLQEKLIDTFSEVIALSGKPDKTSDAIVAALFPSVSPPSASDLLAELAPESNYTSTVTAALADSKDKDVKLFISRSVLGSAIEVDQLNKLIQAMQQDDGFKNLQVSLVNIAARATHEVDSSSVYLISKDNIDNFNPSDPSQVRVMAINSLTDANQRAILYRAIFACIGLRNLNEDDVRNADNPKAKAVIELYNSLNPSPNRLDIATLYQLINAQKNITYLRYLLHQIVANLPTPSAVASEEIKKILQAIQELVKNI